MPKHTHLRRLTWVWSATPVYFITTCTAGRRSLLARPDACRILREEWEGLCARHGWAVGRFVVMPDHVHFFVVPVPGCEMPLGVAIGKWKEWTAKRLKSDCGFDPPIWQSGFFDHLLRSSESRSRKWEYVWQNPVRAGLVGQAEDWPYAGAVDSE
jgi:putative transposase